MIVAESLTAFGLLKQEVRLRPEEYLKLCQVDGSEGAAQHKATILNVLELQCLPVLS